jgi:hypothetical protein
MKIKNLTIKTIWIYELKSSSILEEYLVVSKIAVVEVMAL